LAGLVGLGFVLLIAAGIFYARKIKRDTE